MTEDQKDATCKLALYTSGVIIILALLIASAHAQEGMASYYTTGMRTANGERYQGYGREFTCAHRTAPFGSHLTVRAISSGKSIRCRVNDRGPFIRGRIVDLNGTAARELGLIGPGVLRVSVQ